MGVAVDAGAPTRISAHGEAARQEASEAPGGPDGGGEVEAAAGNGAVDDEDSAALTMMARHHEGAARGATGDATRTHVDAGPARHVGEDRAAGTLPPNGKGRGLGSQGQRQSPGRAEVEETAQHYCPRAPSL